MREAILSVDSLTKYYGGRRVLSDLTLSFFPGEVTLLLGSNGAGKSTLLRILAGLVRPDLGEIKKPSSISYFGHASGLYSRLSVGENLELFASLSNRVVNLKETIETWNLEKVYDQQVAELSKGNEARVSLARAFLNNAEVILLDEPSSALDDKTLEILKTEINTAKNRNALVVIATHDIERIKMIASRAVLLEDGKLVKDSANESNETVITYYRGANR